MFVAPYENQIRLIFDRIKELIGSSPLVSEQVESSTKNPYAVRLRNGSKILGFTTGASSNSGGASLRGQRADLIVCDEMDYMGDSDFENIKMLAAEREDIRIIVSSTPTGHRGAFYQICVNKDLNYNEHYHPSTHNPNWSDEMEAEFRAELTEVGYLHEVMAEFGAEESGVFNKDKVDQSREFDNYAYERLTQIQDFVRQKEGRDIPRYYIPEGRSYPRNLFRTMAVDWDKYGAASSILILEFDTQFNKFRIINRTEIPKSEYTYDNAVNKIVDLNEIYQPSWIYVDRGAGEYQIERLHIIGDQHPETGLKVKVKGFSFSNRLPVVDPISKKTTQEPLKPFMVNQLAIAFERGRIMLSPYDDLIYRQLTNYTVVRIGQNGTPIFTDIDEHFVDALGLAYLAFVLEFPDLTQSIKKIENSSKVIISNKELGVPPAAELNFMKNGIKNPYIGKVDTTELRGERQTYFKVPLGKPLKYGSASSWGSRSGYGNGLRSSW